MERKAKNSIIGKVKKALGVLNESIDLLNVAIDPAKKITVTNLIEYHTGLTYHDTYKLQIAKLQAEKAMIDTEFDCFFANIESDYRIISKLSFPDNLQSMHLDLDISDEYFLTCIKNKELKRLSYITSSFKEKLQEASKNSKFLEAYLRSDLWKRQFDTFG
jgi:hypothetical protein